MGRIYLYPPTQKKPQGKLRLIYECYPLAFLIEQAGGVAVADAHNTPVLDIEPIDCHQRSPLFIGSAHMIEDMVARATEAATATTSATAP